MQETDNLDIDLDFLTNFTGEEDLTEVTPIVDVKTKSLKPIKDIQEEILDEDSDGIELDFLASFESADEEEVEESVKVNTETKVKVKSDKNDIVKAILKEFKTEGLIEAEDDEIENSKGYDDISKLFAKTIKNNEFKDLNEDQIDYLKAIRNGIPKEDFALLKSDIEKVKVIKDSEIEADDDLASNLIYYDFVEQGLSKEKAAILTDSIMEGSKHIELAKLAKKSLEVSLTEKFTNRIKEAETSRKQEEDKALKDVETIKEKVTKIDEIIKGVKVTPGVKDKVINSLVKPVSKTKSGSYNNEVMEQYSSNPDYKVALHYLHVLTDGFTDFSKLSQKIESKVVRKIDDMLNSDRATTGNPSNNGQSTTVKADYKNFLTNFKIK